MIIKNNQEIQLEQEKFVRSQATRQTFEQVKRPTKSLQAGEVKASVAITEN